MDEDIGYMHKKGKQNLRLMILLFFLFLLLYSAIEFYIMEEFAQYDTISLVKSYQIRTGIMLSIWICIMILLWRCSRVGTLLFLLYVLINLYSFMDIPALFYVKMVGLEHQLLRIVYIILIVGKNIIGVSCTISLFYDTNMRRVWKKIPQTSKDDETSLPERENAIEIMEEKQVVRRKDTRLHDKAKSFLQRYALVLLGYVTGCFIVFYICIFFMYFFGIKNTIGMDYVQRTLSLSYLFSMCIWSLSSICMFFYKRWSKWLLYLMVMVEIVRILGILPSTIQIFKTQQYTAGAPITLFILELLRYSILFKIIVMICSNPFINAFWKKKKKHSQKEQLL